MRTFNHACSLPLFHLRFPVFLCVVLDPTFTALQVHMAYPRRNLESRYIQISQLCAAITPVDRTSWPSATYFLDHFSYAFWPVDDSFLDALLLSVLWEGPDVFIWNLFLTIRSFCVLCPVRSWVGAPAHAPFLRSLLREHLPSWILRLGSQHVHKVFRYSLM